VLLKTPRILIKLSTACTGSYPITKANFYNDGAFRFQKALHKNMNIRRITPFIQSLIMYDLEGKRHTLECGLEEST
jgi:hypothetical protein